MGAIGESHLCVYRGVPQAEVADHYGVPRWHEDDESLIDDPAVNPISVMTAETDNLAPMIAALATGKRLLSERTNTLPAAFAPADVLAALTVVLATIESGERDIEIAAYYPAALG